MNILEKLFKNNNLSCSDELNILDIEDNIFYSLDNKVSMYIKVEPINFEYLSVSEKSIIAERLYRELAGEKSIIKIITMTLPFSTKYVNRYLEEKKCSSQSAFKRSRLLKEIEDINNLSDNGDMVEKQIIIQLFENYEDNTDTKLKRRAIEMVVRLKNAGITSYILNKREILQLFNSFINMKFKEEHINDIWSDDDE